MALPREFFIEDRLERYRNSSFCNLGESGYKNFTVREIVNSLKINIDDILDISLKDSPNMGRWDLREEIARIYENVSPEEVMITTGTSEALYLLFNYFLNKESNVSYFSPGFQALYEIPLLFGAKLKPVDVIERLEVEKLFLDSNFVILNHPHNPSGKKLIENDWKKLKSQIEKFQGIILFDEHYRFINLENEIGKSGAGLGKNVFATGSITKSFGVTGLRIGWIIGDKNILCELRSFKDYLTHTVNPISEFLCLELLKKRDIFLRSVKENIRYNSNLIKLYSKEFTNLIDFNPPEAGIVCFPKLKNGICSAEYSDRLMKDCSIFILPGSDFEAEGYIRVGIGEKPEIFEKGIQKWINWDKEAKF